MKRLFILLLITVTLLLPAIIHAVTGAVITATTVTTDRAGHTRTETPEETTCSKTGR
jgi:hypothetical protein